MGKRTIAILILMMLLTGMVAGAQAAKYYQCTEDCPPARPGYKLIGCTLVVNYAVEDEQGSHVPMKSSDGYVYIQSKTDYDENGSWVHDEILACDYWKEDKPVPPEPDYGFEENETEESQKTNMTVDLERDLMVDATKVYNQNVDTLPGFVHSVLGNEIMHVYATLPDGTETEYAAITESGLIIEGGNWIDLDEDGRYDIWQDQGIEPTLELTIDEEGNISYEGLTFGTMVKELFVDIGMALYAIIS